MPALVNISVGSLRGTSGDDGRISGPLSAKNFRNVDLISLTPLILFQSPKARDSPQIRLSAAKLLDKGDGGVQKVCKRIRGLMHQHSCRRFEVPTPVAPSSYEELQIDQPQTVDRCSGCVDSLGVAVFSSYLFKTVMSGEIGLSAGAEGATAPETLRQTNRVT